MKLRRFLKLEDKNKMFHDSSPDAPEGENDYSTARCALEQWENALLDSQVLEVTVMRDDEIFTLEIMELKRGRGE